MLDLKFKDPRIIKVYVPGQGTRLYWYMWYQVINRTDSPHRFVPYFEIVTMDHPAVYPDRHYPTVKDAIAKLEDPTGYQDIKDSVSISTDMIPVSKADMLPRAITGVAIWEAASTANLQQTRSQASGIDRHDALQYFRARPVERLRAGRSAGSRSAADHALQDAADQLRPQGRSILHRFARHQFSGAGRVAVSPRKHYNLR